MYENVLFDKVNGIGWITINRPNHLNALNKQTINELHSLLNSIRTDDSVGVICLTGAGEKAFVAGADIKEFAAYSVAQGGELAQTGQTLLFDFIEQFPKPIIAAINGFALGGGLELAPFFYHCLCCVSCYSGNFILCFGEFIFTQRGMGYIRWK